ncbi:19019_t:CDS:2, partial [Cetraspora pellucida]
PKRTKDFIYFRAESIEYNSITGSFNTKIEMIILYPSQSVKFKHLDTSEINIKAEILILYQNFNFNISETLSDNVSKTHSIINIIADNVESGTTLTFNNLFSLDYSTVVTSTLFKILPAFTIPNTNMKSSFEKTNYLNLEDENNSEEQTKINEKKILILI